MAYTLSKILVGSMTGSFGPLALGASQKKCTSAGHSLPASLDALEMKALDAEFDQLLAERQAASPRPDAKPARIPARALHPRLPNVTFAGRTPVPAAPGQGYLVQVEVTAPNGLKWIRLRYRHVNQKEDYQTADMTPGARTGAYSATIPASFIDPRWDLMYFVEVGDRQGNGRIYPDLELETPYIVARVKR